MARAQMSLFVVAATLLMAAGTTHAALMGVTLDILGFMPADGSASATFGAAGAVLQQANMPAILSDSIKVRLYSTWARPNTYIQLFS